MKDKRLLLAVLAQLEREKSVSIPQLAELLGASQEDVHEALEILVFAYDAASIRLDLHDAHATLETRGTERLLRLTPAEADVLVDALGRAGFSTRDGLVAQILESKSLLAERAGAGPRMRTVGLQDDAEVAQVVAEACEDDDSHLLEIEYRGQDDAEACARIVEPVRLFSRDDHRYLQAYCYEAHDWRTFRLDRIERARILEDRFEPREDVPSVDSRFAGGAVKAHVRFDKDSALPRWHNMRVVQHEDGTKLVSVAWAGGSWLPRHIVALAGAAIPIDPPDLVEACRQTACELLAER